MLASSVFLSFTPDDLNDSFFEIKVVVFLDILANPPSGIFILLANIYLHAIAIQILFFICKICEAIPSLF
jgi:hypothetical protein